MYRGKQLSVVIPSHNEATSIAGVIGDVPDAVDEVLVVDWDSDDGTPEMAAERGARVLREPRQGYGQAYLTGVPAASGDVVITMDADGTYPVEQIPSLVDTLLDRDLEFINCARFPLRDHGAMDSTNRLGNRALTRAANALFSVSLRDLLSGMWVFRRRVWHQLDLRSTSWNLCQEVKIKAATRLGPGFAEEWIPYARRQGISKLSPLRVGAENLAHLRFLRLTLR